MVTHEAPWIGSFTPGESSAAEGARAATPCRLSFQQQVPRFAPRSFVVAIVLSFLVPLPLFGYAIQAVFLFFGGGFPVFLCASVRYLRKWTGLSESLSYTIVLLILIEQTVRSDNTAPHWALVDTLVMDRQTRGSHFP